MVCVVNDATMVLFCLSPMGRYRCEDGVKCPGLIVGRSFDRAFPLGVVGCDFDSPLKAANGKSRDICKVR